MGFHRGQGKGGLRLVFVCVCELSLCVLSSKSSPEVTKGGESRYAFRSVGIGEERGVVLSG